MRIHCASRPDRGDIHALRHTIRVALCAVLAFACAPAEERPARVLLVTIDTLRADHVGAYGARGAHTPTLDALAQGGVRFDAAISPVPLTLPSHATLMTGLDPDRHGVRHNAVFTLAPEIPTLAERMREAGFGTAAFVGAFVLDHRFGLARGFDRYDDRIGDRRSGAAVVGFAERNAGEVVDAFLGWLADAPDPFFAWVHLYDPHARYDPPAGFSLGFPGRPYDGEIAYVDAQLGRLLEALGRRFDPAGTLIIVTADHGESLGEHGESTHSYSVYDATQRVPMIWNGPGFRGGRAVPDVVRLADVAPTLLATLGAAPFAETNGRDLRVVARSGAFSEPAYSETLATHFDYGWSALFSVRNEQWRYIRAPQPELYDVQADPAERRNVVAEKPDIARELDAWIEARRASARPLGARGGLSSDERERLQALGYVAGAANAQDADLSGADPKQRLAVLQALDRAETLGEAKRWAEAYAVLAPFQENGAMFLSIRGSFAVNAGLYEVGERDIRAALEAEPDRPDYLNILALARERRGDDAGASDLYHHLLEIDPNDASASTALGRLAEARRDQAEAERQYRRAIEQRPGSAEPIWRLAALRMEQGDLEIAGALLAEAPDPPDPVLALRVAAVEMDAGRTESASARLEKGLAKGDLPAPFAPAAATILEAGGRLAAALRVYESALAAMPDAWQMKNGVAWCSTLLGRDLDRALELAQQASRASNGTPSVLDTLASVQLRRGEPKAALATAERGLARADAETRPHLLFVRAAALRALGRRADARRGVEAALADGGAGAASWRAEAAALARELGSDTSPPPSPP